MEIRVQDLMASSGVKFGTSGARGLSEAMTDFVCYAYTAGFLKYLMSTAEYQRNNIEVAIAGDFRSSTDRIMEAIRRAVEDNGCRSILCGKIPSPAVALYGIAQKMPAIMVTGSHIPDDRNGIKFNKIEGEILKNDEAEIRKQIVVVDDSLFDRSGKFVNPFTGQCTVTEAARAMYIERYLDFFPSGCLTGLKIGVYQHSAVGRDLVVEIVSRLGADAMPLNRSDAFIPVDTEAIRAEDIQLAKIWAGDYHFDSIISTDGDSDRPLVAEEKGRWLRGDIAGILCAKYLGANSVAAPISCNTALEKCGYFSDIRRTRIGSPYVISAMIDASAAGHKPVVGYEANGGFLIQTDINRDGRILKALPTRDAVIVLLSILSLSVKEGKTISELVKTLPKRFTASDRLKNFPIETSKAILRFFTTDRFIEDKERIESVFGDFCGELNSIDRTDGIRMTFANQEVIHLRPSGNAPEFRCYNEAESVTRAMELNTKCMAKLSQISEDDRITDLENKMAK
ncbi:MAG: phosphomannomutase [Desulfobacterales bacterium]